MNHQRTLWFPLAMMLAGGLLFPHVLSAQEKGKATDPVSITMKCEQGGCRGDGPFCCTGDQTRLKQALERLPGVTRVAMNDKAQAITVEYRKGELSLGELVETTEQAGYGSPKI